MDKVPAPPGVAHVFATGVRLKLPPDGSPPVDVKLNVELAPRTYLQTVSVAGWSSFPMVQVELPPNASVTVLPLPPLVQDHELGV
jgi:hypothetical protein